MAIGIFGQAVKDRAAQEREEQLYQQMLEEQKKSKIPMDPAKKAELDALIRALGGDPNKKSAPQEGNKLSWPEYRKLMMDRDGVDVGPDPREAVRSPPVSRQPMSIPEPTRPPGTMGTGPGSLYREAGGLSPNAQAMLQKIRESETMKLAQDFSRNAVGQPNAMAQSSYAPPVAAPEMAPYIPPDVQEPGAVSATPEMIQKEFFTSKRRKMNRPRIKTRLKSQMY